MVRRGMLLLVMLCLLGGCTTSSPSAQTKPFRIAATHYPVYLAALQVTRDIPGVELSLLLAPQAGYLEDYRLSELDWLRVQEADVLICMGGGLEDFVEVFTVEGGKPVILAAELVQRMPGRVYDPDEQAEPGDNPYIWLSPSRWGQAVDGIAAALAQLDEARSQAYIRNNNEAQGHITAIKALCEGLAPTLAGREAVSLHPAIAYLAQDVGLTLVAQPDRNPADAPEAAQLEAFNAILAQYPQAAVLVETTAPGGWKKPDGRQTVQLNVLTYGAADGNAQAWETAMAENLASLAQLSE